MKKLPKSIKQLIKDITDLKIQSASTITKEALIAVKKVIADQDIDSLDELRSVFISIEEARPTEPFVKNCFDYLLWQVKKNKIENLSEVNNLIEILLARLLIIKEQITQTGLLIIKNKHQIFTHCHSSNVEEILKKAKILGLDFKVFLTETRPKFQGRITAENLVNAGIKVEMLVDSGAAFLLSSENNIPINLVILGCDAIFEDGSCYNKIGSYGIALAAKSVLTPLYIAGSLLKFASLDLPIEERPADEIWPDQPPNLKILNRAFDKIPANLITGYITEFGIIKPDLIKKVVGKNYPWLFKTQNIKEEKEKKTYSYLFLNEKIETKKNIIATFRLESNTNINEGANEVAAESSIGTWTDLKTMTDEIKTKLMAKVFDINKSEKIIKIAYPLALFLFRVRLLSVIRVIGIGLINLLSGA